MLKHLPQLFEYVTGMSTRIGYPNEHLAMGTQENITSPMFATGIGLVMKGFEKQAKVVRQETETIRTTRNMNLKGNFFDKIRSFFEEDVQ